MTFDVYTQGICCMSVCTDLTDRAKIEQQANAESPTGISSRWEISEDNFTTGESNPCPCNRKAGHQHYLLKC